MTRNRTALNFLSAAGDELLVVLVLVLACGLTVSQYLSAGRDRIRRLETRVRRRATRRDAA